MKQSTLFTKTQKNAPKDEVSLNAQLLIRAGFINKVMAGVYEYLPLGLRVLNKINNIIRQEMDAIGGQELLMSVFQNKETWEISGRWKEANEVMYQFEDSGGKNYALGFTHEEPITAAAQQFIQSYKDLPKAVYQIQTKFRKELRAKSGLLRGREFIMKDLYSFHANQKDLNDYYEKVAGTYQKIFECLELNAVRTYASGGLFSKYSDEFQIISEAGEDIIYVNKKEGRAVNKEIYSDQTLKELDWEKSDLAEQKAIEAGNIFKLGTKFSEPLNLVFRDEKGNEQPVIMASYGIGPSRLMGTLVEIKHDEKGIIWPEAVAPFRVHLISLRQNEETEKIYNELIKEGIEVLYDDRDLSAGEKFADSDLIGIPYRIVISKKSLASGGAEIKKRNEKESRIVKLEEIIKEVE